MATLCDRCHAHPARFSVSGMPPFGLYDAVCAGCAAAICLMLGDAVDHAKFIRMI